MVVVVVGGESKHSAEICQGNQFYFVGQEIKAKEERTELHFIPSHMVGGKTCLERVCF